MVKLCNVILNNDAVTVIKFGGIDVQLPAIGVDAKEIWVAYENGNYFRVDADYNRADVKNDKPLVKPTKRASKKTTVEKDLLC